MKILFTGASSFTGSWIVPALVRAGHEVTAVFTRSGPESYEGLRRQRVERVLPLVHAVWGVESGDEDFLALCRDHGPWDLLCLHGAEVGDYKANAFDWRRALAKNTRNYAEMFAVFSAAGGHAVMLTGTYFEADEGNPDGPSEAVSPYGLSKTLTWHACRYECQRAGLALGKFVIPNPVGPLEEPKLVATLAGEWRERGVPLLRTPQHVSDNLPVHLLATEYADFAASLRDARAGAVSFCRPSGWVESVEAFSRRVARQFGRLSGSFFLVACAPQDTRPESPVRRNSAGGTAPLPSEAEELFWREWHDFYFPPSTEEPVLIDCYAAAGLS